jgi:hypothetical protein
MGGTLMPGARLGMAAFVIALIANIPVLAAMVIGGILVSGTRGSVFDAFGELLALIGPIVPSVFGGLSLLALVLGVAANVRKPGQRDGVTAIVIVFATPIVAFAILFAVIAF